MRRFSASVRWFSASILSLLGLCVVLLNGAGTEVQWLPAPSPSTAAVKTSVATGPIPVALSAYEQTWEKPLFNAQRQPDPQPVDVDQKTPTSLNGLTLTGAIVSGPLRKAFFKNEQGEQVAALEQQQLPNGWRVVRIEPARVSLTQGANIQTLKLMLLKVPQNAPPKVLVPPRLSLPDISKDNDL